MKKGWKHLLWCMAVAVFALLVSTAGVFAAASVKTYHWAGDPAIKVGGAWFRSDYVRDEETYEFLSTKIERSTTSSKKGFKTVIEGDGLKDGFATDGKTLYYIQSNVFMSLNLKNAKTTVIKKLKPAKETYYEFHGYFDGKIWLICRKEKYGVPLLCSYNPKTKKFKTEKKNFLCFNPAAASRYLLISEGRTELKKAADATYKLKVYDKKTGKATLLAKKAYPWGYASGGGDYSSMGKWVAYVEYNKTKKVWQIKEYKFKNKKTYVLKTMKKGQRPSIMWLGDGVRYALSKTAKDGTAIVTEEGGLKAK